MSKTTYAAGGTGPRALQLNPDSTGVDKIVDKVAENADVVKDIANNTVDVVGKSTTASIVATVLATKWLLIVTILGITIIVLFLVILLIHIVKFIIKYFNSKKVTATSVAGTITIKNDNDNNFISK